MFILSVSLVLFWQNNISLQLKNIKCYSLIIDIKSNDTITKKLNFVLMKLNENLFFVSIKKAKSIRLLFYKKRS